MTPKQKSQARVEYYIQDLRKEAGFASAKSFAQEMELNPSTYTHYEQGDTDIPVATLIKIADKLNCSLDMLVGRELEQSKPIQDRYDELSDEDKAYIDDAFAFLDFKKNRDALREAVECKEEAERDIYLMLLYEEDRRVEQQYASKLADLPNISMALDYFYEARKTLEARWKEETKKAEHAPLESRQRMYGRKKMLDEYHDAVNYIEFLAVELLDLDDPDVVENRKAASHFIDVDRVEKEITEAKESGKISRDEVLRRVGEEMSNYYGFDSDTEYAVVNIRQEDCESMAFDEWRENQ